VEETLFWLFLALGSLPEDLDLALCRPFCNVECQLCGRFRFAIDLRYDASRFTAGSSIITVEGAVTTSLPPPLLFRLPLLAPVASVPLVDVRSLVSREADDRENIIMAADATCCFDNGPRFIESASKQTTTAVGAMIVFQYAASGAAAAVALPRSRPSAAAVVSALRGAAARMKPKGDRD
jgi:hypothetical protein